jgi:hypothetical protein
MSRMKASEFKATWAAVSTGKITSNEADKLSAAIDRDSYGVGLSSAAAEIMATLREHEADFAKPADFERLMKKASGNYALEGLATEGVSAFEEAPVIALANPRYTDVNPEREHLPDRARPGAMDDAMNGGRWRS